MREELQEKDFIQPTQDPSPIWIYLFLLSVAILFISGIYSWFQNQVDVRRSSSPFFDVTNRELSLFLWENPQFMRANVSSKEAYLPGFEYLNRVTPKASVSDERVSAPPKVLFEYHTWRRLIGNEISPRPITEKEFLEFLDADPEWQPCCWKNAPKDYDGFVSALGVKNFGNLDDASMTYLPLEVRQAFQGWKNFTFEGEAINEFKPTFEELSAFLDLNPHFKRNYWRNLLEGSEPRYLWTYTFETFKPTDIVPKNEIAPFLRAALFNHVQAKKGL
jgi:hypothetical protein